MLNLPLFRVLYLHVFTHILTILMTANSYKTSMEENTKRDEWMEYIIGNSL